MNTNHLLVQKIRCISSLSIFLFILCLGLSPSLFSQSYQTGKQTLTFTDASRSNRAVATDIYYPADAAGNNVPLAAGTALFPVVVFGHGFTLPTSAYSKMADSLVRYGYIVAMPSTETGFAPSHENFGKDLAFVSKSMVALNALNTSFLFQRLVARTAIGGHSMGGGCSFLGASTNQTEMKALFNFAAAETTPSAIAAASLVNMPALVFSGSSDCIVPPANQKSMYDNLSLACKTYINITGGTHCQIANNNGSCVFGQITSGCNSSVINADIFLERSLFMLRPFLDFHLKNICNSGITFISNYNTITGSTEKFNTCVQPTCQPLQTPIVDFNGRLNGRKIDLFWNTISEEGITEYILEKSAEGNSFSELTRTATRQGPQNNYTYEDLRPFPESTFYRLKIMMQSGDFAYSNIIRVKTNDRNIFILASYPNPANAYLDVDISTRKNATIQYQFLAADGRKIREGNFSVIVGINVQRIALTGIPPGIYFIRLMETGGRILEVRKFLRK